MSDYYPSRQIGTIREPGLVLLFSIVSCGFYYLWWIYAVSEEMLRFDGQEDTPAGVELLLCIVTCHIYSIYWDYKMARKVARMGAEVGLTIPDNSILYIVLNLIGLGIVPCLIQQGHLNEIWRRAQQQF